MSKQTICPWCIPKSSGMKSFNRGGSCPHCGNELSGYRTLKLGVDGEDEEDSDEVEEEEDIDWEEEKAYKAKREAALGDISELRQYSRDGLVLDETMERILDDQLEAPECPSCQEYMLDIGTNEVISEQFTPRKPEALTAPLLLLPFKVVMYVCPSCFHSVNRLSPQDQERLCDPLQSGNG